MLNVSKTEWIISKALSEFWGWKTRGSYSNFWEVCPWAGHCMKACSLTLFSFCDTAGAVGVLGDVGKTKTTKGTHINTQSGVANKIKLVLLLHIDF